MASVRTVMTARPAACRSDTPIAVVAQLMIDHDCGGIPVVDLSGHPVGMVTDRDIVVRLVAAGVDTSGSMASDAMSRPARTVRENDELNECARMMDAEGIHRLPVVDGAGRLTGMVSLADLVQVHAAGASRGLPGHARAAMQDA